MMKKICFVTTVSITLKAFVLNTAEYLHQHTDWDITFVCNEDAEFRAELPDYIRFHAIPMERGMSVGGIKAMLQMAKFFKREHFDLVQYSTPNASLYASLAARMAGIPVRLYCQWGLAYVGFQGLKRRIFKQEERLVCALSTHIEPDSPSNLIFAHKEGLYPENKGSVIWNGSAAGVNTEKFDISKKEQYRLMIRGKYHIPSDAFVFVFVGRITRDKGVNELFQAFSKIDNAWMLMVGWNEVDQSVDQELYQQIQNNERVVFTGYTNEVEKYLAASDCYVLPSYREGFGMGVIEAEAMGLPVIVSNIPGPTDAMIDKKTGIVVNKADANDLYHTMKNMLEDKDNSQKMGEEGQRFVVGAFEQKKLFEAILKDRKKILGCK